MILYRQNPQRVRLGRDAHGSKVLAAGRAAASQFKFRDASGHRGQNFNRDCCLLVPTTLYAHRHVPLLHWGAMLAQCSVRTPTKANWLFSARTPQCEQGRLAEKSAPQPGRWGQRSRCKRRCVQLPLSGRAPGLPAARRWHRWQACHLFAKQQGSPGQERMRTLTPLVHGPRRPSTCKAMPRREVFDRRTHPGRCTHSSCVRHGAHARCPAPSPRGRSVHGGAARPPVPPNQGSTNEPTSPPACLDGRLPGRARRLLRL